MTFSEKIFSISSEQEFNDVALEMFDFQMRKNPLYARFVDGVWGRFDSAQRPVTEQKRSVTERSRSHQATKITHYTQIPCLPIEFFKNHKILIDDVNTDQYFASSGTTGKNTSKHFVADLKLYEKSFTTGFEYFFGNPENYVILALLPNYLENEHSSLIYMMKSLIEQTKSPQSGFYLTRMENGEWRMENVAHTHSKEAKLNSQFSILNSQLNGKTIILFGVSYALLDFAEKYPQTLENTLIFETGGMKGRREELSKTELHKRLCDAFGVEKIYSEYGMTELFSQAYSKGKNIYVCPPWMRVLTRPLNDPLGVEKHHIAGGINVIDLANYNSCPFIATQDLGKTFSENSFEILGRIENSDVRGCSLLIAK
jgi:hypothetical protein